MKKEILRMQEVCAGTYEPYGLTDFNLHICEGEMVCLLGLSGSGKTLLYEYFLGHLPLKGGQAFFGGKVNREGEHFSGITDVVCLGRESTLIPGLSVAENLLIITGKRKVRGMIRMKQIIYRARMLLGQYVPELKPETLVQDLSPVECRLVELLRAVENEARLVVIDDAFQGIGQQEALRLLELMKRLKEKKIAILYESHEIDFAQALADKIVVLRKGQIVRTFFEEDYDAQLCQRLLIGTEELPVYDRSHERTDREVFRLQEVFGLKYVKDMNLEFHAGEIVGLYDLNNQKNMELLRMIVGEDPTAGGAMYLNGIRYEPKDLDYAIRRGIGYIPRNMTEVGLVEAMNFRDNLCLPVLKKTSRLGIFRDRQLTGFLGKEYMESLGIPAGERETAVKYFDRYIQNGILLRRWILFRPRLMVCMEPCGNADMIMRDIIFNALGELAKNGSAVLIASQNMNELKTICDTIYVLNSNDEGAVRKYDNRSLLYE